MAKGYWIGHISIRNLDGFKAYPPESTIVVEQYGGRFLARGGRADVLEGELRDRHVVVEFDDFETAKACYESPEYVAARALRDPYCDADIVLVEGL